MKRQGRFGSLILLGALFLIVLSGTAAAEARFKAEYPLESIGMLQGESLRLVGSVQPMHKELARVVRQLGSLEDGEVYQVKLDSRSLCVKNDLKIGVVYFDEGASRAVRVRRVRQLTRNVLAVELVVPAPEDVIQDYDLPAQQVHLVRENIVNVAEGVHVVAPTIEQFRRLKSASDAPTVVLIDREIINNDSSTVRLTGYLEIEAPRLGISVNRRSWSFGFYASEHLDIALIGDLNISEEREIHLWGYRTPSSRLFDAGFSVSLIVGIDGQVSMNVHLDQGVVLDFGASGRSSWWIPRSATRYNRSTAWANLSYEIVGSMRLHALLKPRAWFEVLGRNVIDVHVLAGPVAEATVDRRAFRRHWEDWLVLSFDLHTSSAGRLLGNDYTFFSYDLSLYENSYFINSGSYSCPFEVVGGYDRIPLIYQIHALKRIHGGTVRMDLDVNGGLFSDTAFMPLLEVSEPQMVTGPFEMIKYD